MKSKSKTRQAPDDPRQDARIDQTAKAVEAEHKEEALSRALKPIMPRGPRRKPSPKSGS